MARDDLSYTIGDYVFMALKVLFWGAVLAGLVFGVRSCQADSAKAKAEYDSTHDTKTYTITGTVQAPPESLVRQVQAAKGYIVGAGGFIGGEYEGAVEGGKGFVRFAVESSDPAIEEAQSGQVILIKTGDTKVIALSAGDTTSFVCARDYETVEGSTGGVWELDNCRMRDGSFTPSVE